jgi:hypothetical protein
MRQFFVLLAVLSLSIMSCQSINVHLMEIIDHELALSDMGDRIDGDIQYKRNALRVYQGPSKEPRILGDNDMYVEGGIMPDVLVIKSTWFMGQDYRAVKWDGYAQVGKEKTRVIIRCVRAYSNGNELTSLAKISFDVPKTIKVDSFNIADIYYPRSIPFIITDASILDKKIRITANSWPRPMRENDNHIFDILTFMQIPNQKIQFIGEDGALLAELQGRGYSIAANLDKELIQGLQLLIANFRALLDICKD